MQRTIAILCIISTVATLACGEFILYDDAKEEVLSENLFNKSNSNEKSTWKQEEIHVSKAWLLVNSELCLVQKPMVLINYQKFNMMQQH